MKKVAAVTVEARKRRYSIVIVDLRCHTLSRRVNYWYARGFHGLKVQVTFVCRYDRGITGVIGFLSSIPNPQLIIRAILAVGAPECGIAMIRCPDFSRYDFFRTNELKN